ncbi:MAG: tyrosine-type recombinase/integrase [Thermoanaerobaculia bacterium]
MANPNAIPWPAKPRPAPRRKAKPRGQHNLYLRGGIWWTRICEIRESTGQPKGAINAAKAIRDTRLEVHALKGAGLYVEPAPSRPQLTLGQLVAMYFDHECNFYDREGELDQPGTKRSARTDRSTVKRLERHLDFSRLAALFTTEDLINLRDNVEREKLSNGRSLKAGTRSKVFALLRRVYSWASKRPERTGIDASPFLRLDLSDREAMFPHGTEEGQAIPADALAQLYPMLKPHVRRIVRFMAHTGARPAEVFNMRWGWIDFTAGVVVVDRRRNKTWKRSKRDRRLYLNRVALAVLEEARPENADPEGYVFLGRNGQPIKSVRTAWDLNVRKVWKKSAASRKPWLLYDLRHTAITAMGRVADWPMTQRFAGHAIGEVTGVYTHKLTEEIRAKADEAAHLIDGSARVGVREGVFGKQDGTKSGTVGEIGETLEVEVGKASGVNVA